jgi:predicted PurR-regulated permease PerM
MFNPLVEWIEGKNVPRGLGIALAIAVVVVALTVVTVLAAITSSGDAARVKDGVDDFRAQLAQASKSKDTVPSGETDISDEIGTPTWNWFSSHPEYAEEITKLFQENVSQFASSSADLGKLIGAKLWNAVTGIGRGGVAFVAGVAKALLFAIVAFYLLKDFDHFKRSTLRLVPPARRNRVVVVLGRIDEHLRGFFRGQMMVCFALMLIYAIGLSLLKVPFALVIAFVGGLANIVPYLGLVLGVLPAAILSFVAFGDIWHPLGAIAVFIIGQMIEGTVLTPRIVGRSANLHPVVVILAILLFSRLLGFVGLLLAVPTAAVIKVLVGEALQEYKHSEVYQSGSRHRSSGGRSGGGGRRRRPSQGGRDRTADRPKSQSGPDSQNKPAQS